MTDLAYDDPAIVLEVADTLVEEFANMWRFSTDWVPTTGISEMRVAVGSANPVAVVVEEKSTNIVRTTRLPDAHYPADEEYVYGFGLERHTDGVVLPVGAFFRVSVILDQATNFRLIVRTP